jgi:hypothetical protein
MTRGVLRNYTQTTFRVSRATGDLATTVEILRATARKRN